MPEVSKTAHSTFARGARTTAKYATARRIIKHFLLRKYIAQWRANLQLQLVFRNSHFVIKQARVKHI